MHLFTRKRLRCVAFLLLCLAGAAPVFAAEARVAVAANFTAAMKEIAAAFTRDTGHTLKISYGSTGKLYAQIVNAAPFDVFLSADPARPLALVEQGRASRRFTYALGKLVLWSADAGRAVNEQALRRADFRHLAIANPATAPYGAAALAVLQSLGLADSLQDKLVRGENIAQTYQFVATGNAELGFVALAQLAGDERGARWRVPQTLYPPIRQDAVLLDNGSDNPAALAFMAYLKGAAARALMEDFGYAADAQTAP